MTKTRNLADLGGGFIQAGTGAVQRTVESKLQDVVSVLDFIPAGTDTATTDCTSWIQAALDAHFAVYFPAGVYRLNGSLTLRSGNSLQGPSNSNANTDTNGNLGGAKLIFYGVGDACFKSSSTVSIDRLGFSGITIMAHDNPGRPWVFDFPGLYESNFFCVAATNLDAAGGVLYVYEGTAPTPAWVNYFTNCEFGVTDASTQYIADVTFTDSRIVGSYFTGGKGFHYHGYGGMLFSSCHFDRTNSAGAGLVLTKREATHTPTQQTTIVGCYFDENDEAGIILDGTSSTVTTQWQTVITGCSFRNRNTITADVKFVQPAGQLSYGGILVGCSMTSGELAFSIDPSWTRATIANLIIPGADPITYQAVNVVPGVGNETGGNPRLTFRTSGLTDGSPNTVTLGMDGSPLYGIAYVDTGKGGVAADTPFEVRINGNAKTRVDAAGDLEVLSGRAKFNASITQSTVGVAGAASVLPTNPTGYLKVVIGGVQKVIPYYEA